MTIEVRRCDGDAAEWNDYVEQSPEASVFHRYEALSVLADWTGWELHALVGSKGQEPVGLLPVFETTRGPFREVRSPPPGAEVFYLGPVRLNFAKLKQRKRERRNRQFVEECLDWINTRDPDYIDIRTVDRYNDLRPFKWNGFEVSPSYTYIVDLTHTEEELLARLSSDARSNVRNVDTDYTIAVGDAGDAEAIIEQVQARHANIDKEYPLDPNIVTRLYSALPEGRVRPYICRVDGEHIGGIVTLETDDTIYRWQGGATPDRDLPVNDLLDWYIIRDARERGLTRYDLAGANLPRLTEYKAKFNPDPVPYYVAQQSTHRMRAASALLAHMRSGYATAREHLNRLAVRG